MSVCTLCGREFTTNSIPTWPPGDGGPGYRGHELEIDVFYGGGGGDAKG